MPIPKRLRIYSHSPHLSSNPGRVVTNARDFRIENKKDTLLLVSALNDRLKLGVGIETISNALPYLDARHKFIHADGKADDK